MPKPKSVMGLLRRFASDYADIVMHGDPMTCEKRIRQAATDLKGLVKATRLKPQQHSTHFYLENSCAACIRNRGITDANKAIDKVFE